MQRVCYLYRSTELVPYLTAWQWQQQLMQARKQNPDLPDVLLLVEHPPVYTLGQGSSLEFLKFDPNTSDVECHRTERGGEVTYHAPGQIVGYPILNLQAHKPDLHWYLRQLEELLINVLSLYGLKAGRIAGLTGVWVNEQKIAQIGIKASRWITMHGFALNVNMDLSGFERIVPCGISDRSCCSLEQFVPSIDIEVVKDAIMDKFAKMFDVQMQAIPDMNWLLSSKIPDCLKS